MTFTAAGANGSSASRHSAERHEREVEPDERCAGAEPATDAEPHRQSHGARRLARERRMACLLQHLEHEQIDTGFGQGFGELEVRAALGALVGIRVHVEARRQAGDGTRDRDLSAAHIARFARSRDGPSVDEREVIAMARRFEHEARRGEGVRRDDVGTRGDIVGMDVRSRSNSVSEASALQVAGLSAMPRRRSSVPVPPSRTSTPPRSSFWLQDTLHERIVTAARRQRFIVKLGRFIKNS